MPKTAAAASRECVGFIECEICKLQATVDKEDSVWKSENNVQRKIYEVGSIKSKRFS